MSSPEVPTPRQRYDRLMQEADRLLSASQNAEAVKHFAAAAQLAREAGAMAELATALHRAAIGRDRQGMMEEALWFSTQALRVDESVFGPVHPAVARDAHSLGVVLARAGKPAEAVHHLQRSADISARTGSIRERITSLLALGQAQHGAGNPAEAARTFSIAAELATEVEGPQGAHAVRALLSMATAQAASAQLPGAHRTWMELTRRLAGRGVPPPAIATSLARAWQGLGTLALRGRADPVDARWMYGFAVSLVPEGHPVHEACVAALSELGGPPDIPAEPDAFVVVAAPDGAPGFDVARPTGGRLSIASDAVPGPVQVGQVLRVTIGEDGVSVSV